MPNKKATTEVVAEKPVKAAKKSALSVEIYNLKGETQGTMELPEEVFGQKVNKSLLSQAVRVYQNNERGHFGNTKTRGEVSISTRKIYKQKGTGGARHGAKSAPIFVGGGVAMGPRTRVVKLDLPKKMAKAALISALSSKAAEAQVVVVDGIEKATGKTKEIASLMAKIGSKKVSLVAGDKEASAKAALASANLAEVQFELADQLNVLKVLKSHKLVLTQDAIEKIVNRVRGEK